MAMMYQLGWFSTGRDKAARDLLRAVQGSIEKGELEAKIQFVFCNRRPASNHETDSFLHLAKTHYKLPVLYFSWQDFFNFDWLERSATRAPSMEQQSPLFPFEVPEVPIQAPHPMLLEEFHRRVPLQRRRRHRKKAPLYQIPLVPDGYQIPLLPAEAAPLLHDPFEQWRLGYDRNVMDAIENTMGFHPDLCVLAGYMLIVGEEMCRIYNMINLHPAAPGGPTGTWQEAIWQLIDNEAQETGAMMHLVTPELDKGPPVTYCTFPIRGEPFDRYWHELEKLPSNSHKKYHRKNQLFRVIRQHGLAREFPLIISTVKAFSQGKIKIMAGKVVDAEGRPIKGYNMTDEINKAVEGTIL